jgi:hypothetical protein
MTFDESVKYISRIFENRYHLEPEMFATVQTPNDHVTLPFFIGRQHLKKTDFINAVVSCKGANFNQELGVFIENEEALIPIDGLYIPGMYKGPDSVNIRGKFKGEEFTITDGSNLLHYLLDKKINKGPIFEEDINHYGVLLRINYLSIAAKEDLLELKDLIRFKLFSMTNMNIDWDVIKEEEIFGSFEDYLEIEKYRKSHKNDIQLSMGKLPLHNDGMKLFVSTLDILDPEWKCLALCKTLEYFAWTAHKLDTHNKLENKLVHFVHGSPNPSFLDELIDLVPYKQSNKKELFQLKLQTLFQNSIDVEEVYKNTPEKIKSKFFDKVQSPSSKTLKPKSNDIIAKLTEYIAGTRNSLAHAKPTFAANKPIVGLNDMAEFNSLLEHLAVSAIHWFSRLPDYYQQSTEKKSPDSPKKS